MAGPWSANATVYLAAALPDGAIRPPAGTAVGQDRPGRILGRFAVGCAP